MELQQLERHNHERVYRFKIIILTVLDPNLEAFRGNFSFIHDEYQTQFLHSRPHCEASISESSMCFFLPEWLLDKNKTYIHFIK